MTDTTWHLDPSHGELLLHTGVAGRAAKMGHRLTIAMAGWQATVSWTGDVPTAVRLTVDVESLQVLSGEGGLTPLSTPEKALVRSNAMKTLQSDRYPQITFDAGDITATPGGYRLTGTLEIHGKTHPHVVDVKVTGGDDAWQISGETEVRQSDYGVKRYSMMMGAMQVADPVTVSLTAGYPKAAG